MYTIDTDFQYTHACKMVTVHWVLLLKGSTLGLALLVSVVTVLVHIFIALYLKKRSKGKQYNSLLLNNDWDTLYIGAASSFEEPARQLENAPTVTNPQYENIETANVVTRANNEIPTKSCSAYGVVIQRYWP